jgi:molybdopterin molybdotransferase
MSLGAARDEASDLKDKIAIGLSHDVLVLSGGVSAGVLDLVPQVLESLGVEQVFHKVNLKPGKPLWFGMKHSNGKRQTLVFGLPGNPVSTLVCFELFVRPAIQSLRGIAPLGLERTPARLAREHHQRGERPTYWPAVLDHEAADPYKKAVTPLPWQGSGDLRTLTDANCFAYFPPGDRLFAAGEEINVLVFPGESTYNP